MKILVEVSGGGQRPRQCTFESYSTVVIGSGEDCDLSLEHPSIAARHAVLVVDPEGGITIHATAEGQTAGCVVEERGAVPRGGTALGDRTPVRLGALVLTVARAAAPPAASRREWPTELGAYQLMERIGVGSMAEVFLALERESGEPVAIKRLKPRLAGDEESVKMMRDGARLLARLDHPNLCRLHAWGHCDEGSCFLVMERITGVNLEALAPCLAPALRVPAAVHIVGELCAALDHVHALRDPDGEPAAVVHRALAPDNVMVGRDGRITLIGFSLARSRTRQTQTTPGIIKGRFGYMAPETARGLPLDHRADLFVAGVLLYELACGRRAFEGESDFSTLELIVHARYTPVSAHARVSPALEDAIARALQKDPAGRFASASQMRETVLRAEAIDRAAVAAQLASLVAVLSGSG